MSKLLQIKSSLFSDLGKSSTLANSFVEAWHQTHPQDEVVVRDLSSDPIPHLDAERFQAFLAAPEARTEAQKAIVAESDALIEELRAADVVVLGLPMYNFGIPSQLKSYFDHIARAGVSFRYTANGPEGLLGDKKVYVFAARGGQYRDTPTDTQTGYIRTFLGFLGFKDIEFVYAEGLALGEESVQKALDEAGANIVRLTA
ncbi:FMN-dependent NADH-azoreductase [Algiphilus sp. W345]|uniref:FMN dependent NADH:quinone oxidoreductase n=1 Tax=Banduia mediterranea TaxID=3075609 RepID=A0ABU2WJS7_9GAMM|nr:FMN-dependent NADH-azoreductase [Algiphilus sp. W345]MDT0497785.1 FMN-dependent NADH-azoreductase [Algiphilus sp. W345]